MVNKLGFPAQIEGTLPGVPFAFHKEKQISTDLIVCL